MDISPTSGTALLSRYRLAQRVGRTGIVVTTVIAAIVVNLLIHTIGRVAGANYQFTTAGAPAEVDMFILAGFTGIPLLLGMSVAALLSKWWHWVIPVALIVAPVLEIGSIAAMTLPADLDLTSKVALALCHLALVPITVFGLRRLQQLSAATDKM